MEIKAEAMFKKLMDKIAQLEFDKALLELQMEQMKSEESAETGDE